MQIERNELRVLSAIVEEEGFSRAAERLNLSQSAVSQTMANLEHRIGTSLLTRGRRPRLTEAGQRLFRYAQSVLHEERTTLEDIERIRSGELSTLNLAMSSLVHRLYGTRLLLTFCENNPLTRLRLDVAPSREMIYGVDEDRWELAFGPFQRQMPGHFATRPCFEETRMLVAHENHPLFARLRDDPLRVLGSVSLITSYLDEITKRPGEERLRRMFASIWEISHLELRLALVAAGKGVTYVSSRLLPDLVGFHPVSGLNFSTIPRTVGVYHRKHQPLSEAAKRFLAIVERAFPAAR
ncbi:MAG: LysR family transcriptional regulator [Pseudomonadales bacterium]|nr:LysR family transcriptional regulator [Pseudomonadales bacterium]MCP5185457.1 LysR family transcriptional regulator [Pseudomonadales bacterium]